MSEAQLASAGRDGLPAPSGQRLDSWKAIAEYLGRHVTTVQRWEQEEGLPVHRHHHEKRGSVYAFPPELDAWLAARSVAATAAPAPQPAPEPPPPVEQLGPPPGLAPLNPAPWRIAWATAAAALVFLVVQVFTNSFGTTAPGAAGEQTSIAVLPLTNRSPDQQPDYFVDGMTEALVTDLASLPGVRVIARQSVMQYRNSGKAASQIAQELGADALVEGAVQRSGSRVRVDIRLIDGDTSRALWARTHERDVGDALRLQSEISRAVASELHLTLDPTQREQIGARRPSKPDAWDAYLRARFFWNKRTHDDMSRAIEWYGRALEGDPSSATVYAGLADVYASLGPPKMPIAELIKRGTAAAEMAIALDPTMGEPLAALGKLRAYAWDWQGAETNYRKAIERAPSYAPARYWYGLFLGSQRRCDEALAQAREAEALDPVSLPGNMVVSYIELKCNRVEQAISRTRMMIEFDPDFGQAYEFLGRAYLIQGNIPGATAMLERALALTGGRATIRATLGYAHAAAGRIREAEAIAADLVKHHEQEKVLASAWSVAIAYAGLGRDDAALQWLEHSYADREEWLEALAADERFRRLHGNVRFQRLLYRLGLPHELPTLVTRF
jgi:TolB-like protein/Tfp pilus assembly protein PilF